MPHYHYTLENMSILSIFDLFMLDISSFCQKLRQGTDSKASQKYCPTPLRPVSKDQECVCDFSPPVHVHFTRVSALSRWKMQEHDQKTAADCHHPASTQSGLHHSSKHSSKFCGVQQNDPVFLSFSVHPHKWPCTVYICNHSPPPIISDIDHDLDTSRLETWRQRANLRRW